MSVKVLYQPPEPGDPPPPGHKCALPNPQIVTADTVIQCEECGLRWICRQRTVVDRKQASAWWVVNNWVRLRPVHRLWWVLRFARPGIVEPLPEPPSPPPGGMGVARPR